MPVLVDVGKAGEVCGQHGSRQVLDQQECEGISGNQNPLFETNEWDFIVGQAQSETDRPRGCWWQASNNMLVFNQADSQENCSSDRLCVCCATTDPTPTVEVPAATCTPEFVTSGTPDTEWCTQTISGVELCTSAARLHSEIPDTINATAQQAEDRPSGCWFQPGVEGEEGLLFFNYEKESSKECAVGRLCLCCGDPANPATSTTATTRTTTPSPAQCVAQLAGGDHSNVCAEEVTDAESCWAAGNSIPEIKNLEHHDQIFQVNTDSQPPGCSWNTAEDHLFFNNNTSSTALCNKTNFCVCCPIPPATTVMCCNKTDLIVEGINCSVILSDTWLEGSVIAAIKQWIAYELSEMVQGPDNVDVQLRCDPLIALIRITGSAASTCATTMFATVQERLFQKIAAGINQIIGIGAAQTGQIVVRLASVESQYCKTPADDTVPEGYAGQAVHAASGKFIAFAVGGAVLLFVLCYGWFHCAHKACHPDKKGDVEEGDRDMAPPQEDDQVVDAKAVQRNVLIDTVFRMLNTDGTGVLTAEQSKVFGELCGFKGSMEEWKSEFDTLCWDMGSDPQGGLGLPSFMRLVNEKGSSGCYCTEDDMIAILRRGLPEVSSASTLKITETYRSQSPRGQNARSDSRVQSPRPCGFSI